MCILHRFRRYWLNLFTTSSVPSLNLSRLSFPFFLSSPCLPETLLLFSAFLRVFWQRFFPYLCVFVCRPFFIAVRPLWICIRSIRFVREDNLFHINVSFVPFPLKSESFFQIEQSLCQISFLCFLFSLHFGLPSPLLFLRERHSLGVEKSNQSCRAEASYGDSFLLEKEKKLVREE